MTQILVRSLLGALLLAGIGVLAVLPSPAIQAKELNRDEQIKAIEKQIADLTKKLADLKKAPTPVTKPKADPTLPDLWTKALQWRCVGPASMGGRIVALAVYPADPTTFWIATASGGLLKTTNGGTTFEHQFDRETTVSIGDVAVAPSNKDIVWVGTGEHNPRNSVSFGDGVYKSIDGGKKWTNMGLKKTFQIGRVVIHPKNPDIVYVGALGRLYGPSEERGVYKTTDGGKTWKKVLQVDNNTGVIEMKMNPADPETLLVATWERRRDGFDSHAGALARGFGATGEGLEPPLAEGYDAYDPVIKYGKGSGIWKTTDGGKNFKRITKGLPTNAMGRIGLDYYAKDPKIVFAIIDCEKIALGEVPGYLGAFLADDPKGCKLSQITANTPAAQGGLKSNDIVTMANKTAIKNREALSEFLAANKPGTKIVFSVLRDSKPVQATVTLGTRPDPFAGRQANIGLRTEDTKEGVKVTAVLERGRFARLGFKVDDVIVEMDKTKALTRQKIIDALGKAKPATRIAFKVLRAQKTETLTYVVTQRPQRRTARPYAFFYGGQRENVQNSQGPNGHEYGGVYKSVDGGESWTRVNSVNPRPMYFSQIRIDPTDDKRVYVLGMTRLYRSEDGGKKFTVGGDRGVHPDHHAMWINPRDSRHILMGTDGGTYVTYDRCANWDYLNTMAIGQFYHVCVDNKKPYNVYGGMQDNGSWGGPSHTLDGRGPINSDWKMMLGGDGFVCRVDPNDADIVYCESQEGNLFRRNLKTNNYTQIKPIAPRDKAPYRFNWNTPFILSSHNSKIVYCAGNYVFRSVQRGNNFKIISPELSKNAKATATALAESPKSADEVWVGTDDGHLYVTRDGGEKWTAVASKVGLPKPYWVSTIEPSRHKAGRCYVCFDAHRSDNDDPHVYVTEDHGQTWKSLRGNLPAGSSRVLREDLFNPDVLYLGTEFGVWASIDRGASWTKINNNLPTVAVHELAQHPTAGEIVAATHGRSIWILDVTPLRQLKPATAKAAATLLAPNTAIRWRSQPLRGTVYGTGSRGYAGQNPAPGAHIYFTLTAKAKSAKIQIQDYAGKTLTTLTGPVTPGMHRVTWNLVGAPGSGFGITSILPSQFLRNVQQAPAAAGTYRVVLTVDGKTQSQGLKLENDPTLPATTTLAQPAPKKRVIERDE